MREGVLTASCRPSSLPSWLPFSPLCVVPPFLLGCCAGSVFHSRVATFRPATGSWNCLGFTADAVVLTVHASDNSKKRGVGLKCRTPSHHHSSVKRLARAVWRKLPSCRLPSWSITNDVCARFQTSESVPNSWAEPERLTQDVDYGRVSRTVKHKVARFVKTRWRTTS